MKKKYKVLISKYAHNGKYILKDRSFTAEEDEKLKHAVSNKFLQDLGEVPQKENVNEKAKVSEGPLPPEPKKKKRKKRKKKKKR